jgi:DNA-binding CsgD family transcriptional regulator
MKPLFTPRENEIRQLVGKATLRKDIADQLQMSIHTVNTHLRSIRMKTNTSTMAELVLFITSSETPIVSG